MQTATIIALALLAMTALAPAARAEGVADGDTFHSPGGDSIDCLEFGVSQGPSPTLADVTISEQNGTTHSATGVDGTPGGDASVESMGPVTLSSGHAIRVSGGEAQYHHADWDPGVWKPMVSGSIGDCDDEDGPGGAEDPETGRTLKGAAPTGSGPTTPKPENGHGEAVGSLPQGVTSDRRGLHAREQ